MIIKVSSISYKCILLPLIALLWSVVIFCAYDNVWMFFCCLLAYIVQLGCISFLPDSCDSKISLDSEDVNLQDKLLQTDKNSKNKRTIFIILFILLIFVDLFPFLAMGESFCMLLHIPVYEGGVLSFLMSIFIIGILCCIFYLIVRINPKQEFFENLNFEKDRIAKQAKEREKQETQNQLRIEKYGQNYQTIPTKYNELIVSEEKRCIYISDKKIAFESIIGANLVDDVTNTTTTTTVGSAKTSTSNMLGRAVVGGVITGGLGAVAGAATAKKNIATDSTSTTITVHNYTLYINVKSIVNPTIELHIGDNSISAHRLLNTINAIIQLNQSN